MVLNDLACLTSSMLLLIVVHSAAGVYWLWSTLRAKLDCISCFAAISTDLCRSKISWWSIKISNVPLTFRLDSSGMGSYIFQTRNLHLYNILEGKKYCVKYHNKNAHNFQKKWFESLPKANKTHTFF